MCVAGGKDLSLAPGFGGLIPLLFALPMVVVTSSMPGGPLWLAADDMVQNTLVADISTSWTFYEYNSQYLFPFFVVLQIRLLVRQVL